MMHGSGSGGDHFVVPASVMPFGGLEGSGGGGGAGGSSSQSHGQKQHTIWEWEAAASGGGSGGGSHDLNTSAGAALHHNHAFFPGATAPPPFMDCPAPPLLPMNGFPFYLPPAAVAPPLPPEYHMGLIKSEDGGGGRIIGLNLGHRTYFSPGDHALSIDRLFAAGSSSATTRGLLYPFGCSQPPRCQAEGCKVDLSGAKHYHRRHKVCELHSKAAVVIVAGLQQRFCQQCSRFHVLAEFDDAKRSCRKRLADHNRRRRKPPPPPAPHGADSSSSSLEIKTKSQPQNSTGDDSTVHARAKGAALLSLNGGRVAAEKEGIAGTNNNVAMHRAQGIPINVAVGEEKLPEEEQRHNVASSPSAFNSNNAAAAAAYFHHHNLFCSSSHDDDDAAAATGSAGGDGSSGGQSGASDHQQHHLFGLGHQSLFEVDYM